MSDDLINQIIQIGPYYVVKGIFVIILFLHVLFSIVIVRQTRNMLKVVEVKISPFLYLISFIHFFASLGVLFFTLLFV
jgi:hypothetical protein